jgi:RND family efflux transporter MFP subunit
MFSILPRFLAGGLCAILLLAACQEKTTAPAVVKAALTVNLIAPQQVEWPDVLVANGNVVAWQEAVIGAEVANYRIAEVRVQVGDTVRRGEVLARIASDTVASELAEATAAVAEMAAAAVEADGNAERSKELRAKGFYSVQLDAQFQSAAHMAQARLAAARARLQTARLKMDKTEVRAPDDGIISARRATVGSLTQPGEELFRLIRGGRLEWRAEAPSADLLRAPVGASARLTAPGGASVAGVVRAVAPSVDPQTRNGLIYVDLPAGSAVRAGMFARGEFELGRTSALALPQTAVALDEGFAYVFRLDGDNRVARVKVQLGRRVGDQVEIVSGLTADAKVVASGGGFLADGDVVNVVAGGQP